MSRISQSMVRDSIDAFMNGNIELAKKIIMTDDIIDDLTEKIWKELMGIMTEDPSTITRAVKISYVSKYLERIADHAANIAEDVICLIGGKIIRHMEPDQI